MSNRFLCFAVILTLAACSSGASVPQAPPIAPKPVQIAPPAGQPPVVQSGDWIDWPLAAGDWVYRQDARGSIALFGQRGKDALLTLRCDRQQKRVYLSRIQDGQAVSGRMTIRSSAARKDFATGATGSTPAYVAAEIMPTDTILDAMVFTRGRIAIEVPGLSSLAIPVWSEVPKIVEDCRK
jgi:hypothetical protein